MAEPWKILPDGNVIGSSPEGFADMAKQNFGFEGWNTDNMFDYNNLIGQARTFQEQGGETAGLRDWMQGGFNEIYEPLAAEFRQTFGEAATNDDDAGLFASEDFRNWVQSGKNPNVGPGSAANRQMGEVLQAGQEMAAGGNPMFTVPGQDLSPDVDAALQRLMGGYDPLDMEGRLGGILDRMTSSDPRVKQNRLEAARENLTRGSSAALADMRGVLADRGLISLPGSFEGAETDATIRALDPLQRNYLEQVRQIDSDEQQRTDDNTFRALEAATGWSRDQAAQMLSGAQGATGRQQMLSDVALRSLEQNQEWNRFLAEFGLKREEVAAAIQSGRMESLAPILQLFMAQAQAASGGYI